MIVACVCLSKVDPKAKTMIPAKRDVIFFLNGIIASQPSLRIQTLVTVLIKMVTVHPPRETIPSWKFPKIK